MVDIKRNHPSGQNLMVDHIYHNEELISLIIRTQYEHEGITFFTHPSMSQQLAYMKRPKHYVIEPHVHKRWERQVLYTQEVLFIKSGKVRVDFYGSDRRYLESRIVNEGDVVLLASGGHGFEMLEESEIVEVKQGPYLDCNEKSWLDRVDEDKLKIVDAERV